MDSTDAPVEASLLVVALMPLCGSILAQGSTDTFYGSIFASGGTDTSLEVSLLRMTRIPLCGSILVSDGTDALIRASLP